jgi:hypothetical protein
MALPNHGAILFLDLCDQALDELLRRLQSLGDCRTLWNGWRLRIEHDDSAQLSFRRHEIEEQSV